MTPPDDGPEPPEGEEVGSVGEEAAKLFGAFSEWARDQAPGPAGAAGVGDLPGMAGQFLHDVNEHLATGSEECRYCPLCRTVHAVRQTTPEVRAHLAQAASSFLQAAAGLLATLPPPPGKGPQAAPPDFERIDLDEDEGHDTP